MLLGLAGTTLSSMRRQRLLKQCLANLSCADEPMMLEVWRLARHRNNMTDSELWMQCDHLLKSLVENGSIGIRRKSLQKITSMVNQPTMRKVTTDSLPAVEMSRVAQTTMEVERGELRRLTEQTECLQSAVQEVTAQSDEDEPIEHNRYLTSSDIHEGQSSHLIPDVGGPTEQNRYLTSSDLQEGNITGNTSHPMPDVGEGIEQNRYQTSSEIQDGHNAENTLGPMQHRPATRTQDRDDPASRASQNKANSKGESESLDGAKSEEAELIQSQTPGDPRIDSVLSGSLVESESIACVI